MARSEARLQFGIWRGLDEISPFAKLLYAVVLTEPTLNYAGVCALRERRWAKDAGLTIDELTKALHELQDSRHLIVDDDTEEVMVRTFIRNDGVATQPNLLKAALREARQIVSPVLRRALAVELRRLPSKPDDTPKMRYPDPHTAAAELDPHGPPTPPPEDPSGTHPDAIPDGIANPSGTHPDRNPSGNPSGNPSEWDAGTPGGRGGGRGSSSLTLVSTQVPRAAAAATRAHTHTRTHARGAREAVSAAELAATAHSPAGYRIVADWAAANPGVLTGHRRDLGKAVDQLLAQGADPTLLAAALTEAHDTRFRSPAKALPLAYDDVRRARQHPATGQPANATDARILALLQGPAQTLPPAIGGSM